MAFVIFLFICCVCDHMLQCVCGGQGTLSGVGLSFHQAGSGVQTVVTGLSSRHHHALSHPADPGSYFIGVESKSEAAAV